MKLIIKKLMAIPMNGTPMIKAIPKFSTSAANGTKEYRE
jgi:hypothetical protein